jgi:hypothetical protein
MEKTYFCYHYATGLSSHVTINECGELRFFECFQMVGHDDRELVAEIMGGAEFEIKPKWYVTNPSPQLIDKVLSSYIEAEQKMAPDMFRLNFYQRID